MSRLKGAVARAVESRPAYLYRELEIAERSAELSHDDLLAAIPEPARSAVEAIRGADRQAARDAIPHLEAEIAELEQEMRS